MGNNRIKNTTTRGSALLMAVVLIAVLSIGAAALFKHLHDSFEEYRRYERDTTVLHLADAGIDKAIAALRHTDRPTPETLEFTLGEGVIQVHIAAADDAGAYHITSQAALRYEGITRATDTYTAVVRVMPGGDVRRLSWKREKRQ